MVSTKQTYQGNCEVARLTCTSSFYIIYRHRHYYGEMAVANSTACTEDPSTRDTTILSICRPLVTTEFWKKNNVTYLEEHFVNIINGTNKFRRVKRSEYEMNHDVIDYAAKPSDISASNEALDEFPQYVDKNDNIVYNNIMYDNSFETKHNSDTGKYNIDEPEYLVKGKYLSTLAQNDKSLYFSHPMYNNRTDLITNDLQTFATQEMIDEFELITNKIYGHQEASTSNLSKYIYINQPKQKQVLLKPANNNQNYDLLEFTNTTKLMHEAQYHIDSDNLIPIDRAHTVENIDPSFDDTIETLANRARYANEPQGTNNNENVDIKKSIVKRKYKRNREEKYLLDEYGPVNTLMIETTRKPSFDDKVFTPKLITSSSIEGKKTHLSTSGIRKEETHFFPKFKTGMISDITAHQKLHLRKG